MEYCELGSVKDFLTNNKTNFVLSKKTPCVTKELAIQPDLLIDLNSTYFDKIDLFRFCCEISRATEFLQSRHIIHGDLAARNVLLTSDLVVKLADFGLATESSTQRTEQQVRNAQQKP